MERFGDIVRFCWVGFKMISYFFFVVILSFLVFFWF